MVLIMVVGLVEDGVAHCADAGVVGEAAVGVVTGGAGVGFDIVDVDTVVVGEATTDLADVAGAAGVISLALQRLSRRLDAVGLPKVRGGITGIIIISIVVVLGDAPPSAGVGLVIGVDAGVVGEAVVTGGAGVGILHGNQALRVGVAVRVTPR